MRGYWEERERQESIMIEECYGYETEMKSWREAHQLINFNQWLKGSRRS